VWTFGCSVNKFTSPVLPIHHITTFRNDDVVHNFSSIWLYVAMRATCSKPKLPHKQRLQIEKKPWMGSQYGAQHALPKWGKLYLVALIFHSAPIIIGISTQKFNYNIHLLRIHGGIERMEIIQKMAYACVPEFTVHVSQLVHSFLGPISWLKIIKAQINTLMLSSEKQAWLPSLSPAWCLLFLPESILASSLCFCLNLTSKIDS
jgi:hypothetical protein